MKPQLLEKICLGSCAICLSRPEGKLPGLFRGYQATIVRRFFRSLRLGQVRLQLAGSISKEGVNAISKEGATLTS
jgi:hypothetical protein